MSGDTKKTGLQISGRLAMGLLSIARLPEREAMSEAQFRFFTDRLADMSRILMSNDIGEEELKVAFARYALTLGTLGLLPRQELLPVWNRSDTYQEIMVAGTIVCRYLNECRLRELPTLDRIKNAFATARMPSNMRFIAMVCAYRRHAGEVHPTTDEISLDDRKYPIALAVADGMLLQKLQGPTYSCQIAGAPATETTGYVSNYRTALLADHFFCDRPAAALVSALEGLNSKIQEAVILGVATQELENKVLADVQKGNLKPTENLLSSMSAVGMTKHMDELRVRYANACVATEVKEKSSPVVRPTRFGI